MCGHESLGRCKDLSSGQGETYFRTFKVIFFGADEPDAPGLVGSGYQSFAADTGGLVARGEGTDGTL